MIHLIKDSKNLANTGVILLHQSTIESIREQSGTLAKNNEYQVHYWALVLRITMTDNSILDIAIPTVFYNYNQIVSSSVIEFEFQDVSAMSTQLEPIHNVMVNKLMVSPLIANLRKQYENNNIEYMSVATNSLPLHP